MKRGKSAAFDEDDYYDDDGYDDDYGYGEEEEEDYYDEGDYHKKSSGTTKPAPPPKFQPVTSSIVTTSSPVPKNKPAFPLATTSAESDDYSTAADKEIIDSMLPILRSSMLAAGMKAINFKQAQLVEALRHSNYDMDSSVAYLKTNNNSSSNNGSAIPSSVSSPTTAGKAKVLTIGGSSKKNHVHDIPARNKNNSKNDDDDDDQQQQQQKKDTNTTPAASPSSPSSTRKMPKCELSEVKNASGKTQISIVFAGHVDHGKSTTVGHLLYQLGQFTDREVQKMEQAAKRAGKGTFHFAWLLDQSDEERRRGVTIDSGIHSFETDHHTVSILDAPGHEQFIENMASSSAQADIAVLILSGQPGELAVGIEHNTRKHVQILKRIGISRLIVAINKMDSVDYAEEAFRDAEKKVLELLKEMKFDVEKEVVAVLPISGLAGVNLTERPTEKSCPALAKWYNSKNNNNSPCLLEVIDKLDPVGRMHKFPFRFVVSDNNGKSVLSGKIQCGSVSVGDSLLFLPSNCKINVRSIDHSVTGPVKSAVAGDTVEIISSSDITPISVGDIGCQAKATSSNPHCLVGTAFEATIQTYGQHARAILPGHSFVLMINGVQVQAKIRKLLQKMDMNTGNWSVRGGIVKMIPKDVQGRVLIEVLEHAIPFERASDCMPLGKFLMKQEMNIVGGGLIEELVPNIGELLPKPVTGAPGQQ